MLLFGSATEAAGASPGETVRTCLPFEQKHGDGVGGHHAHHHQPGPSARQCACQGERDGTAAPFCDEICWWEGTQKNETTT